MVLESKKVSVSNGDKDKSGDGNKPLSALERFRKAHPAKLDPAIPTSQRSVGREMSGWAAFAEQQLADEAAATVAALEEQQRDKGGDNVIGPILPPTRGNVINLEARRWSKDNGDGAPPRRR